MSQIPKISDDEIFKAIDEQPGYYISNLKRIYSTKSNKFMTIDNTRFKNNKGKKVALRPLWNKYFNQPDEMNLIAIIRYGTHKFKHLYYDKLNNKFYKYKNDIYIEIEQHDKSKDRKQKTLHIVDEDGVKTQISPQVIKRNYV